MNEYDCGIKNICTMKNIPIFVGILLSPTKYVMSKFKWNGNFNVTYYNKIKVLLKLYS